MEFTGDGSRFFFSSRRRHTRSKRDWSSDVCSSDLTSYAGCAGFARGGRSATSKNAMHEPSAMRKKMWKYGKLSRSEERRVGKECRSRWRPERQKKREHRQRLRHPPRKQTP